MAWKQYPESCQVQPTGHPGPSAALEISTHGWVPCHYLTPLQPLQAPGKEADHNI